MDKRPKKFRVYFGPGNSDWARTYEADSEEQAVQHAMDAYAKYLVRSSFYVVEEGADPPKRED